MQLNKSIRRMGASAEKKRLTIGEFKPILEEAEFEKLAGGESVVQEAIASAEQDGIVFIDGEKNVYPHIKMKSVSNSNVFFLP